jgi:hypothetical protein
MVVLFLRWKIAGDQNFGGYFTSYTSSHIQLGGDELLIVVLELSSE